MSSDRHSIPVAVDRAYGLWVWLDGRLVDFPAAARPLAGRRIFDAATDLLDALLDATYAPRGHARRGDALVRANQRLALLRLRLLAVRDPKPRTISVAPFRDRIVHQALAAVPAPRIERRLIGDCYACRPASGLMRRSLARGPGHVRTAGTYTSTSRSTFRRATTR